VNRKKYELTEAESRELELELEKYKRFWELHPPIWHSAKWVKKQLARNRARIRSRIIGRRKRREAKTVKLESLRKARREA